MDISSNEQGSSRILIVDDETINFEIIAEYLQDTNFELLNAEDGAEAWSILENNLGDINLVLLDRMLPGELDGLQILLKMKEHPVLKYIPVIFQTAKVDQQDIIDGLQAGAFYYLTKPFQEEMLKSVVNTALNEHQTYLALRNELKSSTGTLSLMRNGCFHFKTLKEANNLALLISKACPNPEKILSGLSELMINAVEHGDLGITYEQKTNLVATGRWQEEVEHRLSIPENINKFSTLEFQLDENRIEITIKDMGAGFDWREYLEIALDRMSHNHGRGIAMARILSFDNLEYHGSGNEVTATIYLQQPEPQETVQIETLATT